jgi:hypothetical protein
MQWAQGDLWDFIVYKGEFKLDEILKRERTKSPACYGRNISKLPLIAQSARDRRLLLGCDADKPNGAVFSSYLCA